VTEPTPEPLASPEGAAPRATSIGSKIVVILFGVVAVYALLDNLIQRTMVSSSFIELEEDAAVGDLGRSIAALQDEVERLEGSCRDWAGWSVARTLLEPGAADAVDGAELLADAGVHLLFACDGADAVRWSRIEAPGDRAPIALRDFPSGALSPQHPLLAALRGRGGASVSGLLTTEAGPMLLAAARIPGGDGPGDRPPVSAGGTLLFGRFVDGALTDAISARTRVEFSLFPLDAERLPPAERALLDRVTGSVDPITDIRDEGSLYAYAALNDLRHTPTLLVRARLDREISARGFRTVQSALLSSVATALLILLVLLVLLQRIVIRPLSRLTQQAIAIGRTEDTSVRLGIEQHDEIGLLSREFDRMLEKLAQSRAEVIKTARMAGMSEIATGVIHNVGNVLNSVNVSSKLVAKRVKKLPVDDLTKLAELLRERGDDLPAFFAGDPRAAHLVPFLGELAAALDGDRSSLLEEIGLMEQDIGHIVEMIQSQQTYAGGSGVVESTSLARQLESALSICRQATGGAHSIEVVREVEELPEVPVDRNKLVEILVNLIQNAYQSMDEAGVERKLLTLRLTTTDGGGARIEIGDNGKGIAAEDLERIFNHGFTTRPDGHGFGLHISANSATEMGARLTAHSDGPGRGAVFRLDLPLAANAPALAA